MSELSDQDRSIAFARRHHGRLANSIIPFRWGSAYVDEDVPLRYGSNFLWVDGSPVDATAAGLIAEADRILGGAGFRHRIVAIDDADLAARVRPGFVAAGWDLTQLVLMVLSNLPSTARPRGTVAREASYGEIRDLLERLQYTYEPPRSPEAMRVLVEYTARLESVVGARFFVAEVDDEPVSVCDLYIDGTEAQIEAVNTLPDFRNRGFGTAIMRAAIEAARTEGVSWIHLYAEGDDWPRYWYEKLGFEVAAGYSHFHLYPDR